MFNTKFYNQKDHQLFESVFKKDSHTDVKGYFEHEDRTYKAALITANYNQFDLNIEDTSYRYEKTEFNKLENIAESANAFLTIIDLPKNWHNNTIDALILFTKDDHQAYVYLPVKNGSGKIIDPLTGKPTSKINKDQFDCGYIINKGFRSKKNDNQVNLKILFKEAMKHNIFSLILIFSISIIIAVLGWFTPILTSQLISESIPKNLVIDFIQLPMLLLFLLVIIFIFSTLKNLLLNKIIIKSTYNIQSAIFHRALYLPISYFAQKSASSASYTILSLQQVAKQLANGQANAIFSVIIAFFSSFMMLYYLPKISLIIIGILFIYFLCLIIFSLFRVKIYLNSLHMFQSVTGYLYQLCRGITKIKATASESQVLTKWYQRYAVLERIMFKVHSMDIYEKTFKSGINISLIAIIFICIYFIHGKDITLGDYIGFSAAFGQFFVGINAMANLVNDITQNVSTVKMTQSFLATKPELNLNLNLKKIQLSGGIKARELRYIYPQTTEPVLKNINFDISPGEFVAFAGSSGCGKSTLLKLLLGFNTPNSGLLMYDNHLITQLNLRSLRKQFGVVLQNAKLISGNIKKNIQGANEQVSENDLWQAAETACIADEIQQMPMGMQTVISSSDTILSKGQAQRVLIARALINKPKILFFDEATSALDTITQATIMKNIEEMGITRIVIAHRLSTIKHADTIFVVDQNQIIEQGNFQSLIKNKGKFHQLVAHELKLSEEQT